MRRLIVTWSQSIQYFTQFFTVIFLYLVSDHDVGDFCPAVHIFMLLLISENRQHKVARLALTLSHQKAARLALLCEELLRIPP